MKIYDEKVEEYRQKDDKKKADMVSKKKELVAKEVIYFEVIYSFEKSICKLLFLLD